MKPLYTLAGIAVVVGAVILLQHKDNHVAGHPELEVAIDKAKVERKYVFLVFSGSDWCGWCIRLDKEVFSQKAFQDYAKDNLVLMLADFPRDKSKQSDEVQKQNEQLAKEFSVRSFPMVFILSPEGKTLAKTGYQLGGPEAYVEHIKKLITEEK